MMRWIAVTLAALLFAAALVDPYTFRETASDAIMPAPWWQTALGLADAALLGAAGILIWRRRPLAFWVVGVETLYALALGIGFVERDGVTRFVAGIGAEEYLSLYFGTLALRVVLLMLVRTVTSEHHVAAT